MTTYIALRELFTSNKTALQGVASSSGTSDSHNGDVRSTPSPSESEDRPAKRFRATSNKSRTNDKARPSKRVRGRLSELPTMPLDIVYEILGHLLPVDLLSLSRVDRAFRDLLMSRRSSSLWRASYGLMPGVPTCPEDMSEPAWAHLLFGGAYCYSCGAKPVTKILFSLRRRACKSCMKAHLLCASSMPKDVRELFHLVTVPSGTSIHPSKPWCIEHVWDDDIEAVRAEFNALAPHFLDSNDPPGEKEGVISEYLDKKKRVATKVKQHALLCLAWEKDRNADRSAILSNVKAKRFENIKARFAKLGYVEEDVSCIRWHREVSTSKPMSDRVWQRVEPLLIPEINRARDSRLQTAGNQSYLARRSSVVDQFADFMGTISPLLLAFLPSFAEFLCRDRSLADAITLENDPDNTTLNERSYEAMCRILPELETQKRERASLLRSLLPRDDAYEGLADEDALALAISQFECVPCHQRASGLHMLAHRCFGLQRSRNHCPRFNEEGKKTVETLLKLMGLGKRTTALELDRRNDRFVCGQCPLVAFLTEETYPQRRIIRDWRSCISHMCVRNQDKTPGWVFLGERETAELFWDGDPVYGAYSCMHCPPRVDRRNGIIQWQGLCNVKKHLKTEHARDVPLEGEDFFFDYATRRTGKTTTLRFRSDGTVATPTAEARPPV